MKITAEGKENQQLWYDLSELLLAIQTHITDHINFTEIYGSLISKTLAWNFQENVKFRIINIDLGRRSSGSASTYWDLNLLSLLVSNGEEICMQWKHESGLATQFSYSLKTG